MKAILPQTVSIRIDTNPDGTLRFHYAESFLPEHQDAVKNAYDVMKAVGDFGGLHASRPSPLVVAIDGNCTHATAGNVLTGEFLCWSEIANVTLRDLLVGGMGAAVLAAKHNLAGASEE